MSIPFLLPVNQTLTNSAIAYAALGFRVIPVYGVNEDGSCQCGAAICKAIGKHPIAHGWQKRAVTPPEDVVKDRARHPDANIGLAMGPCSLGYLVCIDIDKADAWDDLVTSLNTRIPDTLESRSGRGRHLFFLAAAHHDLKRLTNRCLSGALAGIDVRAAGGQVLAAPSRHKSGTQYAWVREMSPATLPDELFDIIANPLKVVSSQTQEQVTSAKHDVANEAYVQKALDNACTDIARCSEGSRNATLNKLASVVFQYAAGLGWPEARAMAPLESAALVAGLEVSEVRATLASAWRYAVGSPRAVPEPSQRAAEVKRRDLDNGLTLATNKHGKVETCLANAVDILAHDPKWIGRLTFDSFAHEALVTEPPWPDEAGKLDKEGARPWTDLDDERLQSWLFRAYGVEFPASTVRSAVRIVSARGAVHPVTDYLSSLTWDGVSRCERLFGDYMGATNNEQYLKAISVRWMVSAVARVFQPGCKVDFTPILEGAQDRKKSTAIRTLASGPWFRDSAVAIGTKDGYDILRGCWILEFGELDSVSKHDVTKVKAFLTSCVDSYRPPYLRRTIDVPRQTVFVGSTNEKEYLRDPTGNRRFWPVACGGDVDVARLEADRNQLWAEAVALYKRGQAWWVDSDELKALCSAEQAMREPSDEWTGPIKKWLQKPTSGAHTIHSILCGAMSFIHKDIRKPDEMRCAQILRRLGYDRKQNWLTDEWNWEKVKEVKVNVRCSSAVNNAETFTSSTSFTHSGNMYSTEAERESPARVDSQYVETRFSVKEVKVTGTLEPKTSETNTSASADENERGIDDWD